MSQNSEKKRVHISKEELETLTKDQLIKQWLQQEEFINSLEPKPVENDAIKESEERLKIHQIEAQRRENVLVMRLAQKEHEMQDYMVQIQELKHTQIPTSTQLKTTHIDPAINYMFDKMKKELESTRKKLEETQNELSAWKFTPDRCGELCNLVQANSILSL